MPVRSYPMTFVTRAFVLTALVAAPVAVAAQTAGGARTNATPTFAKDVAPILYRSCVNCHRPGQVAPRSLLTDDSARPWVRSIKERVSRREMPPWHIDRSVGIKEYKDDPSLSDQEIDTVVRWVDAGAPQGNAADMPKMPTFASDDD